MMNFFNSYHYVYEHSTYLYSATILFVALLVLHMALHKLPSFLVKMIMIVL
ncbi:MAG: hypothetical protein ACI9W6_000890 [Motiliproteus sp.]|jgi:hypothetical protein